MHRIIIVVLVLVSLCSCSKQEPTSTQKPAKKTEQAQEEQPKIHLITRVRITGDNSFLEVYCHSGTGNLIYIAHGDYNRGNYESQPITMQVQQRQEICK